MATNTALTQFNSNATIAVGTIQLVTTVFVWIVLSFTQQRTKKALKTCGGRPGIVFPINFLNPRHRLVYVLACGALASEWFGLLTMTLKVNVNKWASPIIGPFVIMFLVTVVIISTYPILACLEAPIPLVGYIMGAIYCDIYFVLSIYLFAENLKFGSNVVSSYKAIYYSNTVVSNLPKIICLIGILIWYHYKLIKQLLRVYKTGNQWKLAMEEQPHSMNHINYVKQLLQPPENPPFFKKHIITRNKLPFPVLIVAVVVAIIIFQLTVFVCFYFPYLFDQLGNIFEALLEQSSDFQDNAFFSKLPRLFKSLTAISVLSPIFATVFCCVLFIHFIYFLRLRIQEFQARKGELFGPTTATKWPVLTLSSSVRYTGYQIAAYITTWIVYTVVIFVIGIAIMALIIIPSVFGYYYYKVVVLIGWTVLIIVIQIIICKVFFVSNDSADLKTVIIDNRRAFNMFSYIVLLYNMASGLTTAIIRIGLSFLFMIMILPRMDRLMYVKGFEKCDSSHGTFKNFILIETLLHNPIVHVFVDMLTEIFNKPVISASRPHVSQKAYNRWFVTYTLIKNPQLTKSFKRNDLTSVCTKTSHSDDHKSNTSESSEHTDEVERASQPLPALPSKSKHEKKSTHNSKEISPNQSNWKSLSPSKEIGGPIQPPSRFLAECHNQGLSPYQKHNWEGPHLNEGERKTAGSPSLPEDHNQRNVSKFKSSQPPLPGPKPQKDLSQQTPYQKHSWEGPHLNEGKRKTTESPFLPEGHNQTLVSPYQKHTWEGPHLNEDTRKTTESPSLPGGHNQRGVSKLKPQPPPLPGPKPQQTGSSIYESKEQTPQPPPIPIKTHVGQTEQKRKPLLPPPKLKNNKQCRK